MSDTKSPQDLSMDEILATIRRIISEEERSGGSLRGAGESGEPAAVADDGDSVLELTDALNDDGSLRRLPPIGASQRRADRPPEPPSFTVEPASPGPLQTPQPEPERGELRPVPAPPERKANDGPLISPATSATMAAAFARLSSAPRDRREPPMVGDRPLDDIVRELLRPLLRTWLDENLPRIVEQLVEAEIARAGQRPASE